MSKEKTTKQLQAELDEIIAWFESDDIDLDEAVEKYKQGNSIIEVLQERLKNAEITIKKISKL